MDRLRRGYDRLFRFLSQPWVTALLAIIVILFIGYLNPLYNAELGLSRVVPPQDFSAVAADGELTTTQSISADEQPVTRLAMFKTIRSDACCCPVAGHECSDDVYSTFARADLFELEISRSPACFCQILRTWEHARGSTPISTDATGGGQNDVSLLKVVNWLKRFHLTFDFIFPIIYGLGLASLIAWLARRHPLGLRQSGWPKALFALPFLAWLLDWLENGLLLLTVRRVSEQGDLDALPASFIRLMTISAWIKWWLVIFVGLMILELWIWSGWRTYKYWCAMIVDE